MSLSRENEILKEQNAALREERDRLQLYIDLMRFRFGDPAVNEVIMSVNHKRRSREDRMARWRSSLDGI